MAKKFDQARAGLSGPVASEARPGDLWSGARQRLGWEPGQTGCHDRKMWCGPQGWSQGQQAGEKEAIQRLTFLPEEANCVDKDHLQAPKCSVLLLWARLNLREHGQRV